MNELKFKVSYTYDSPGPAGPNRGSMEVSQRYARGNSIRATFGRATVKSCRVVKPAAEVQS